MLLPDDDEIYEVDQTYLGPPGRYLGVLRHKAIMAWFVLGPLAFVIERKMGFPLSLISVGLTLIAVTFAAMWVADHATQERPMRTILATFWNELTARRAPVKAHSASGAAIAGGRLSPRGSLAKAAARMNARADSHNIDQTPEGSSNGDQNGEVRDQTRSERRSGQRSKGRQ